MQPDNGAFEALHPPMPRRQSCDRCHEQKVRCVTHGHDGVAGLGLVIEESEASLGKSVIAPVSCQRCEKAGAVCIYSPQLRSGRPRVHRSPPRRRTRKASKCPSSSSSPSVSPTIPHPLSPGLTTPTFPPKHVTTLKLEHRTTPLTIPSVTAPLYGHGSRSRPGVDASLMLLSHFGSDDNLFPPAIGTTATFSHSPDLTSISSAPFFTDECETSTPRTTLGGIDQPWMYPKSFESPTEEIIHLNLRIHRAGRLLTPMATALLSLSSPEVNELFDATCSFISFVEQNAARQTTSAHTPAEYETASHSHHSISPTNIAPSPQGRSTAICNATDTSVCLMVFACHQLLLGIFEDLCSTLSLHVKDLRLPAAQVLVTVNFISHLLEQLDNAVGLLAANAGYDRAIIPHTSGFHGSFTSSADFSRDLKSPGIIRENHGGPQMADKGKSFSAVLDQADRRQSRVTEQVMGLKRLLAQTPLL
ncbi:hypothetical protein QBC35DRAFT_388894 [Podospora australis]|uniref:Zn(2)-C6 fungal-type domain-containing protein n=1 Tax=Podospora australis TaxID=1536484 RepID=A0AAN6WPC2_9PEZI|nr:hypothetical protein QBC35DRAFT_388894 [Podospora australis]